MSDRVFWVLFVLAAVGLAALFGSIHIAVERFVARRQARRRVHPHYDQPTHVRVVDQRQEIRTR